DPNWRNYQPATYLADLQALATVLAIRRAAIIGTSLGGLLAMMLAAAAPERVAGIVLNDIGPDIDPKGAERIMSYAGVLPPVRTWAEAVSQLRTVYGNAWPGLPDAKWAMLARRSYRVDANGTPVLDADQGIGRALRAPPAAPNALWPVFAKASGVSMLVIRGELSDILSLQTLERMQREKPDLEQLTVANRGHVP